MGTRAVIIFGKTKIATHWDGDPESLGEALNNLGEKPTLEQVVQVASKHTIDFATKDVQDIVSTERFERIAKKTNGRYTAEQLKKLYAEGKQIVFPFQSAEDYPIGNFNGYNDLARYEYEILPSGLRYRRLHGEYGKGKQDEWVETPKIGAIN